MSASMIETERFNKLGKGLQIGVGEWLEVPNWEVFLERMGEQKVPYNIIGQLAPTLSELTAEQREFAGKQLIKINTVRFWHRRRFQSVDSAPDPDLAQATQEEVGPLPPPVELKKASVPPIPEDFFLNQILRMPPKDEKARLVSFLESVLSMTDRDYARPRKRHFPEENPSISIQSDCQIVPGRKSSLIYYCSMDGISTNIEVAADGKISVYTSKQRDPFHRDIRVAVWEHLTEEERRAAFPTIHPLPSNGMYNSTDFLNSKPFRQGAWNFYECVHDLIQGYCRHRIMGEELIFSMGNTVKLVGRMTHASSRQFTFELQDYEGEIPKYSDLDLIRIQVEDGVLRSVHHIPPKSFDENVLFASDENGKIMYGQLAVDNVLPRLKGVRDALIERDLDAA